MIKVNARDCVCTKISYLDYSEFCNKYHKQGTCFANICYGMFHDDELVQIMSFGEDRFGKQAHKVRYDYEMFRECSKENYSIRGGKSKLLKQFISDYNPYSIVSYCSLEHGFDGHSYLACGFTKVDEQKDSYHYERDNKVYSRFSFQKNSNLRKIGKKEPIQKTIESVGGVYDFNMTERENAESNGFVRVSEKGNIVFELLLRDIKGYVYKTTNRINGKIYVGQHLSNDINDSYLGSGSLLTKAIEKYGKDNFQKEILESVSEKYICDYQKTINELEVKYIRQFNSTDTDVGYNILDGGQGVDSWINSIHSHDNEEMRKSASERMKKYYKDNPSKRNEQSERMKRWYSDENNRRFVGEQIHQHYVDNPKDRIKLSESAKNRLTDEVIKKISESNKQRYINNPQLLVEMSEQAKQRYKENPQIKKQISKSMKKYAKEHLVGVERSDETKRKISENKIKYYADENNRKKASEIQKKVHEENPNISKAVSEKLKAYYSDEKNRERSRMNFKRYEEEHPNFRKECWKNEEFRKNFSEKMKEVRKNTIYRKKSWYTNGTDNVCVLEDESAPNGYWKGRTIPKRKKQLE